MATTNSQRIRLSTPVHAEKALKVIFTLKQLVFGTPDSSRSLLRRSRGAWKVDGEDAAASLLRRLGGFGETARELAYRLYTSSVRKNWAQEALAYNSLVIACPELARCVSGIPVAGTQQVLEI
jgi:hypothetical protein